jgi:hypothetical protein
LRKIGGAMLVERRKQIASEQETADRGSDRSEVRQNTRDSTRSWRIKSARPRSLQYWTQIDEDKSAFAGSSRNHSSYDWKKDMNAETDKKEG